MIEERATSGTPATRRPDQPVRRRGLVSWVDVRGRRLGGWAFALNRATGLGVLLYLYLHLVILSMLAGGPGSWDGFVSIAGSPILLLLDVVLLFGLLAHGLNGIRVSLVGLGIVIDRQRALFVAFFVMGLIVFLIGAVRIFGETGGGR
jgi:succinate dehydrogenase / fumarate reductase cytochrome b subunit